MEDSYPPATMKRDYHSREEVIPWFGYPIGSGEEH